MIWLDKIWTCTVVMQCLLNLEMLRSRLLNDTGWKLCRGIQLRYIRTHIDMLKFSKDLRERKDLTAIKKSKLDNVLSNVDEAKIQKIGDILSNEKHEFKGVRSRFNKARTKSNRKLVTKPPAQIERELKALFKKDGVEYDPAFVQDIIKRSKTEEEILNDSLKGGYKLEKIDKENVQTFVSWMIKDCGQRILNPEKKGKDEDTNMETTEPTATTRDTQQYQKLTDALGIDLFETCLQTKELSKQLAPSGLEALPGFLEILNHPDSADSRKLVTLEQLMQIFVISGQIDDDKLRNKCLYLTGNLISMATSGRADPINEMMYIQALAHYKEFEKAIHLFDSRRHKNDVSGQRFWLEMGAEIYLRMPNDHTKVAEQIASEIFTKFHYIHPILQLAFIEKYLALSEWGKAFKWWGRLKNVMNEQGLCEHIPTFESQIVKDPQMAYDYYNRVEALSFDNVLDVIMDFMKYERLNEMMSVIEAATLRDKRFLLYLTDKLRAKMSYPGREYLCQCFEEDLARQKPKHEPVIEEYILSVLNQDRPTILNSKEEAELLDEICSYLSTQLVSSEMSSRERLKASSLISSLAIGSKITSFDAKNLMKVLFVGHNRKGYDLASRALNYMNTKLVNIRIGNKPERGIFPPANAHLYITLVQLFGRRDKPKLKEIKNLISMMEEYQIPILTVFANQVILTYLKAKQYTKATEFLDKFLGGDDPNSFPQPTSQFVSTTMHLYRSYEANKCQKRSPDIERIRLQKLRRLFKILIQTPGWKMNNKLLTESILTFMTFGDYASAICALEYIGFMENNSNDDGIVPNQMILPIKTKLNSSIVKMERHLDEDELGQLQPTIKSFRERCGLLSLDSQLLPDKVYNWRDAAAAIIQFEMIFDFNPRPYSLKEQYILSSLPNTTKKNRHNFESELSRLQKFYDLPPISIDQIV